MKKLIFLVIILFSNSCIDPSNLAPRLGCFTHLPTDRETYDAIWYYNNAGARSVSSPSQKVKDLFKCYYKSSDQIYSYKTLFHEGYILVRKYQPIISVETK
ncbi:MAG: hypothetical protein FJ368_00280 [Pelagibacterales bacterium]|nr:hypothetical protein [Pelagibacterales bacterium]